MMLADSLLAMPRAAKRFIALSIDGVLCVATVLFAYYLRLGEWIVPVGTQWLPVVLSPIIAIPIFIRLGLYRAIFRYAGWSALTAVARAGAIYTIVFAAIFAFWGFPGVPRTIGLIQPILLFLTAGATRAVARFWLGGGYAALMGKSDRQRVLIYGAGSSGRQLAAALANSSEMVVLGYVDDDETLHGSILNGKPIHAPAQLEQLVTDADIENILLAVPSASRQRRNEIIAAIRKTSAGVRTLPGLLDLAQGKVSVNDLRDLDIEDLLGRESVIPDETLLAHKIAGKTVLVTGAGGSIGSELCRQILRQRPKVLLLVEMSEYALYQIHQELEQVRVALGMEGTQVLPLLASVLDATRLSRIMEAWRPHAIYHAAAYKHVPLVEHNPVEGARNNIMGTLTMAQVAREWGVADFVLISTDKAVRPTNIMGTTKRTAEMILQAFSNAGSDTCFSMVRFGNVLGSSGSVVPLFRKQIKEGGPVTITHKDVIRYFMTIPEAAQLVLQAGAMARGGEVFVLDMGEPVRIFDLARNMIELSGLSVRDDANPEGDIAIEVVGLRPGEKLYEELLIGDNPEETAHPKIMMANEEFLIWPELKVQLDGMRESIADNDAVAVRSRLMQLVPDFVPTDEVVDYAYLESTSRAGESQD